MLLLCALALASCGDRSAAEGGPLDRIFADRPRLAALLDGREALRSWLASELEGHPGAPVPRWDPAEPVSGRAAELEFPGGDSRVAPGTVHLRVSRKRNPRDQFVGLVFELHNLRGHERFEAIHEAAVRGSLTRDEYATRMLTQEFEALGATRAFLNTHAAAVPGDLRRSRLYREIMDAGDSIEGQIDRHLRRGSDLREHFRRLHDTEVIPERNARRKPDAPAVSRP